jgi:hypothetical protein
MKMKRNKILKRSKIRGIHITSEGSILQYMSRKWDKIL